MRDLAACNLHPPNASRLVTFLCHGFIFLYFLLSSSNSTHLLWMICVWAHSLLYGIISLLLYFSLIISTCAPFWLLLMFRQPGLFKNKADRVRECEKALSQLQLSATSISSLQTSHALLHLFWELGRTMWLRTTVYAPLSIVIWWFRIPPHQPASQRQTF